MACDGLMNNCFPGELQSSQVSNSTLVSVDGLRLKQVKVTRKATAARIASPGTNRGPDMDTSTAAHIFVCHQPITRSSYLHDAHGKVEVVRGPSNRPMIARRLYYTNLDTGRNPCGTQGNLPPQTLPNSVKPPTSRTSGVSTR